MSRPISVDMITPYQGRLVLDDEDPYDLALDAIDEEESNETKSPSAYLQSEEENVQDLFPGQSAALSGPDDLILESEESFEPSSIILSGTQTPSSHMDDEIEDEKVQQLVKKKRRSKSISISLPPPPVPL